MTFLPIVARELRVTARRPGMHWFRLAVAALALAAGAMLLLGSSEWGSPEEVGVQVFRAVTIAALCFALLAGPFLTADALSAEARDGTLGLLFLTDLRSYDVVLGKLAAASLNTAAALVATAPLLALPILAGGVTPAEFALAALALASTLAVSLSVSLACSACTSNSRVALMTSLTALGALGGLPWVGALPISELSAGSSAAAEWLLAISPVSLSVAALTRWPFAASDWMPFLACLQVQALIVSAAIGLACDRTPKLTWANQLGLAKAPAPRQTGRTTDRGAHPFWLAVSDRATRRLLFRVSLFLTTVFAVLLAVALMREEQLSFVCALGVAYFLHLLVKCQFAAEAADRFHHDRMSGGLEVLLTTPLPARTLLHDYWRGLRQRFAASRLLALSVNAACVLALSTGSLSPAPTEPEFGWMVGLLIAGGAFIWLDCRALTWTGLRASLGARTAGRTIFASVARVLAPGWAILFFMLLWEFTHPIASSDDWGHAWLIAWMVLFTAWDLWLARHDRRWLERNLRCVVSGESPIFSPWQRWRSKFLLPNAVISRQSAQPIHE